MLILAVDLGIKDRCGVEQSLCFRVTAGHGDLGIDVQDGGSAAWRIDGALKSIGEVVLAIKWSIKGRLEGSPIAGETNEPIR